MIKAVFFDIDDTLYDQTEPFFYAYKRIFGNKYTSIDLRKLFVLSRKRSDEVFEPSQKGEITMEEMYIYRLKMAMQDMGLDSTDEEALEFQKEYAFGQSNISMSNVLKTLMNYLKNKVDLGIITNGPSKHQWNKVNTLQADRYMKKKNIIVSGDLGIYKPDVRIFKEAEKAADCNPESMLYVGDNYINDITGAKAAGWKAIWFNRWQHILPADFMAPDYVVYNEHELYEQLKIMVR